MRSIDLISENVPELGAFLVEVAPVTAKHEDPAFSSYESERVEIMLSPSALVPMTNLGGVILHFQVDDVEEAVERAGRAGHEPSWGPARTDWGTYSALFTGPDGVIVDLFTPVGG